MTAQTPDRITINFTDHMLAATPLDPLLLKHGLTQSFESPDTANWRGYVASWAVRRRKLWLKKVHAFMSHTSEPIGGLSGLVRAPDASTGQDRTPFRDWRGLVHIEHDSDVPLLQGPEIWLRGSRTVVCFDTHDAIASEDLKRLQEIAGEGLETVMSPPESPPPMATPNALNLDVEIPNGVTTATQGWIPRPFDLVTNATLPARSEMWSLGRVDDGAWWRVEDLVLRHTETRPVDLDSIGDVEIPTMASWVTGELRVPQGELLHYVHGGFASVYERDLLLAVEKGRVVGRRVVNNRTG